MELSKPGPGTLSLAVMVLAVSAATAFLPAGQVQQTLKPVTRLFSTASDLVGYAFVAVNGQAKSGQSVLPGTQVEFALSLTSGGSEQRDLRLFDLNGNFVETLPDVELTQQVYATETPWVDGAGFKATAAWTVPRNIEPGLYLLENLDDIFVIVRSQPPAAVGRTVFVVPTNTINAYSTTLGRSFYAEPVVVPTLSFLRPMTASLEMHWLSLARWAALEPSIQNLQFISDADLETPGILDGAGAVIVGGHSEYWTRPARETFDAFVRKGGDAVIAGGNIMWWQARIEGGGTQLTAYKSNAKLDPIADRRLITTVWTDRRLGYQTAHSIGGDFRNGGYGGLRHDRGTDEGGLRVMDAKHPLFAGLNLSDCDSIDLGGVSEYDGAAVEGLSADGRPVVTESSEQSRTEILAWEWGYRGGQTLGTMHIYQPAPTSGHVLHMGAVECCDGGTRKRESKGMLLNRQLILQFLERTRAGVPVFSNRPRLTVVQPLTTPSLAPVPVIAGKCGTDGILTVEEVAAN